LKQEEETVIFKKTNYNQLTFQQILMDLLKFFKLQTQTKQAAFEIVASYLSISVWTLCCWYISYSKSSILTVKAHKGGKVWLLESEDLHLHAHAACQSQKKGFTASNFFLNYLQKNENISSLKSVKSAQRYLRRFGFIFGAGKRGLYIDGHEREDVVSFRKVFCQWIMG
jgi:hypothetical protein